MSKTVVHDGHATENSEGGSVSEPQENLRKTAMTLAIKVERATDMVCVVAPRDDKVAADLRRHPHQRFGYA